MKRLILAFIAMTGSLFATDPPSLRNSYNPAVKDGINVWIDHENFIFR